MNTQKPNAKYGRAGETGHSDQPEKQPKTPSAEEKKKAFDQGIFNNSNPQTGTAQSGYDEKNPKHPGGKQEMQPKVTNEDNDITNSQEQNIEAEEPVEERSEGNSRERTDPEINAPIPDEEDTEKKIPTMKA
jgi:hypothetical protein